MIELFFKTIIFFTISFVYFFSIIGYGKVIVNKNSNYFEAYLDGTILLLIIRQGFNCSVTLCKALIIEF